MEARNCREVSLSAKAHALAHIVVDETLHDICRAMGSRGVTGAQRYCLEAILSLQRVETPPQLPLDDACTDQLVGKIDCPRGEVGFDW
ncbi:hypothetical protein EGR_07420 [Echinococcus granulosus]|uniref:Uncharacterized protein n=1 Tax=Echinococcus granulosus TaxID=6210 RepID=W6U9S3_ECHGR|nr:hypothetical protein EGR_07420 [Echinococcus granulosus]EUB57760.1 hypothetical protein EGR_07420 [Echinococcus granulosus]